MEPSHEAENDFLSVHHQASPVAVKARNASLASPLTSRSPQQATAAPVDSFTSPTRQHAAQTFSPLKASPLPVAAAVVPLPESPSVGFASPVRSSPQSTAVGVALSSPARSPIRPAKEFASPCSFTRTPPPPAAFDASSIDPVASVADALSEASDEMEQDLLAQSFALCAQAKAMLDAEEIGESAPVVEPLASIPVEVESEAVIAESSIEVVEPEAVSAEDEQINEDEFVASPVKEASSIHSQSPVKEAASSPVKEHTAVAVVASPSSPATSIAQSVAASVFSPEPASVESVEASLLSPSHIHASSSAVSALFAAALKSPDRVEASLVREQEEMECLETEVDLENTYTFDQPLETESEACSNPSCLSLLDLSENLSLEVLELNERYNKLQEEGSRLFKQYEIRSAMLKHTKSHNQSLSEYINKVNEEHETMRTEYKELYLAYQELEEVYYSNQHSLGAEENDEKMKQEVLEMKNNELALAKEIQERDELIQELRSKLNNRDGDTELGAQVDSNSSTDTENEAQWTQQLATLQNQLDQSLHSLSSITVERDELQQTLLESKSALDIVEEIKQESQEREQKILDRLEGIKNDLKQSQDQLKQSQHEFTTSQEQILSLNKELDESQREVAQYLTASKQAYKELDLIRGENEQLQEDYSKLIKQRDGLQVQLIESQKILNELKEQVLEIPLIRDSLSQSETVLSTTRGEVVTLQSEIDVLLTKESTPSESHDSAIASLKQAHSTELANVEAEHHTHLLAVTNDSDQSLLVLQDEIDVLTKGLESLTTEKIELEQLLQKQDHALASVEAQALTDAHDLDSLRAQVQDQSAVIAQRDATLIESHSRESTVRAEKQSLQTELSQSQALVNSLEHSLRESIESHSLDLKLAGAAATESEGEINRLQGEVDELTKKAKDYRRKLDDSLKNTESIQTQLEATHAKVASMASSTVSSGPTKAQYSAVQAELELVRDQLLQIKSEKALLSGRLDALSNQASAPAAIQPAALMAEVKQLREKLRLVQEENSSIKMMQTSSGVSASEVTSLRNALTQARAEADQSASLRSALTETRLEAEEIERSLRADKEQLLQQVELLMETAAVPVAAPAASAAQIATLQAHNAELKAYVQRYKVAGETKMSALSQRYSALISSSGAIVRVLVERGLVKREEKELYQLVQQMAMLVKEEAK